MLKSLHDVMVVWKTFLMVNQFLVYISIDDEMDNTINSTMNCVVIFNCSLGCQLGFSLLDFYPEFQQ